MERLVFIDTETTGVSRADRIIEIGMVEVIDGVMTGSRLHEFVSVDRPIHWAAKRVHGISERDLIGKPRFSEIAGSVLSFIGDSTALAHNAPFDAGMLRKEWDELRVPESSRPHVICTLKIASSIVRSAGLDALISRYLPGEGARGKHSAVTDAELLARVFIRMREESPGAVNAALLSRPDPKRASHSAPKAPQSPVGPASTPALSPCIATLISEANREGSVEMAVTIRTGRDAFSSLGEADLLRIVGDAASVASSAPEGRRMSALRMMARGLDPRLAVSREERLAEIYDARPSGPSF